MKCVLLNIILFLSFGIYAQVHINTGFANKQLVANAGSDKQISAGSSVQIGALQSANFGFPGYSYLWLPATGLNSNTLPNPIASPDTTTNYILMVTDSKGCSDVDTVKVTVNGSSGIDEINRKDEFEIIHDNVKDQLIVNFYQTTEMSNIKLRIFNLIGQKILEKPIPKISGKYSSVVPMSGIVKGVYILKIEGKSVNLCKKFSVN